MHIVGRKGKEIPEIYKRDNNEKRGRKKYIFGGGKGKRERKNQSKKTKRGAQEEIESKKIKASKGNAFISSCV